MTLANRRAAMTPTRPLSGSGTIGSPIDCAAVINGFGADVHPGMPRAIETLLRSAVRNVLQDRLPGPTNERRVTKVENPDRGHHDSTKKCDPACQHCRRSSDIVVDTDTFQRKPVVASVYPASPHRHGPIVELAGQIAGLAGV